MSSFNKITLIGNVGSDPSLRTTPGGKAVCSFTVATNDKRQEKGEVVKFTTWFKVTAWGSLAEFVGKHVTKSMPIYVEGKFHGEEWVDKGGHTRTTFCVTAADIQMLPNPRVASPDEAADESDLDAK